MRQNETQDEVADQGGDHPGYQACPLTLTLLNAKHGHPRFCEKGWGIPDRSKQPEKNAGSDDRHRVESVVNMNMLHGIPPKCAKSSAVKFAAFEDGEEIANRLWRWRMRTVKRNRKGSTER